MHTIGTPPAVAPQSNLTVSASGDEGTQPVKGQPTYQSGTRLLNVDLPPRAPAKGYLFVTNPPTMTDAGLVRRSWAQGDFLGEAGKLADSFTTEEPATEPLTRLRAVACAAVGRCSASELSMVALGRSSTREEKRVLEKLLSVLPAGHLFLGAGDQSGDRIIAVVPAYSDGICANFVTAEVNIKVREQIFVGVVDAKGLEEYWSTKSLVDQDPSAGFSLGLLALQSVPREWSALHALQHCADVLENERLVENGFVRPEFPYWQAIGGLKFT